MTDETSLPSDQEDMENEPEFFEDELEYSEGEQALNLVQDTMETFLESATVDAVYGEPIVSGDHLIIPAAEVLSALGFGVGSGYGSSPTEEGEGQKNAMGGGSGGGGGGRVLSRPVAVVIASPEGVRVEPVVDVTKIVLAGLTAAGFMLTLLMRMANPRKGIKDLSDGDCC
jgi:uncharacterized spore protein YtfJ